MMLIQKVGSDINQNSIIRKISKYEVVSFDIFDTLIKRDCLDGSFLFKMMERYLTKQYTQFQGFAEARKKAEQDARKKSLREESLSGKYMMNFETDIPMKRLQFWKIVRFYLKKRCVMPVCI